MSPTVKQCCQFLDEVFQDLIHSRTTTREAAERMHQLFSIEEEQSTWKQQKEEMESAFGGRFYL